MKTITKKELSRLSAHAADCPNNLTEKIVDNLFRAMREQLTEGNRIEIRGFGVFTVKATKPKPAARNPRTGEITPVPARRKVQFKLGSLLRQALHKPPPSLGPSKKSSGSLGLRDAIIKVLKRRRNRWMTYDEISADIERLGLLETKGDARKKITAQVSQHKELFEKASGRPAKVRLSEVGLERSLAKMKKK